MSEFVPNSYQTPNLYCDKYLSFLTGAEWKVLSFAARRIFGFQKRQDRIALSQFVTGTVKSGELVDHGTGLSKPTVISALDSLCKFGFMIKLANNNPLENKGDLYSLQLDEDKIDLSGLQERAEYSHQAIVAKTASARVAAAAKRQSIPLVGFTDEAVKPIDRGLVKQFDRGVVNGIDLGESNGLTGGGQSNRPGVVNGIDTQNTGETQIEIQKETQTGSAFSHPVFDQVLVGLRQFYNGTFDAINPRLYSVEQKPNRFTVIVNRKDPALSNHIRSLAKSASGKVWQVKVVVNPPVVGGVDMSPADRQARALSLRFDQLCGGEQHLSSDDLNSFRFLAEHGVDADWLSVIYKHLKSQKWRTGRISPRTLADNYTEVKHVSTATNGNRSATGAGDAAQVADLIKQSRTQVVQ